MLPVSDFNFMVAGIATFAATVGYTYARVKLNSTTIGTPDSSEQKDEEMSASYSRGNIEDKRAMEAGPSNATPNSPTQGSLKRKEPHDGFEEEEIQLGYPQVRPYFCSSRVLSPRSLLVSHSQNLAHIYPRKRCRTPTSGKAKEKKPVREATPLAVMEDSFSEDWIFVQHIDSPHHAPPRTPSPVIESSSPTPAAEVMDSPLLAASPIPSPSDSINEKTTPVIKPKELDCVANSEISPPEERPETNEMSKAEPMVVKAAAPMTKFGQPTASAFGKTSSFPPVAPAQKIALQKPITSPFVTRGFADFAGDKSPFGTFAATQASSRTLGCPIWLSKGDDTFQATSDSEDKADKAEDYALRQAKSTIKPVAIRVTGEENEDTEMELKGVRLYVKRGEKPFAEGIVGHCKLLKDRTTLEERLLLRREPLWKISMNVRVNPSLRCSFDMTENVLRIVTKEPRAGIESATSGDATSLDLVVYALKAGRSCSKQEFKAFSDMLINNPRLKPSSSA